MSKTGASTALFVVTAVVITVAILAPRVAQPLSYHNFADHRSWLGIQNFGDVVSNLPFALVGVLGLVFLVRHSQEAFLDARERLPYYFVFPA